jgi:hypothetical protein
MGQDDEQPGTAREDVREGGGEHTAYREQPLRRVGVGHRGEDLGGALVHVDARCGGRVDDLGMPLPRLRRDVEVADRLGPEPDRLADRLRPLGDEQPSPLTR